MLVTMNFALAKPVQIIIAGSVDDTGTRDILKKIRAMSILGSIPGMTIFLVSSDADRTKLKKYLSIIESIKQKDGRATAYVCKDYTCSHPVTTVDMLLDLLKNNTPAK